MRAAVALVMLSLAAVSPARAEDVKTCEVTSELLATDSVLSNVAEQIKSSHQLTVVVLGSGSSTLAGPDGSAAAYPARFEFYLAQRLPDVSVHVTTELHLRQTAEEAGEAIDKLVNGTKPTLVVWQTGTVDALRSVDPDDFRNAISEGVAALKSAGVDVILMNPQYNPQTETVISITNYLDDMRAVAQERDAPLFDRFAIMRHWNETGDFDLSITTRSLALARGVHDCIGRVLADFVVGASRINAAN
jgi:hypothetical protein